VTLRTPRHKFPLQATDTAPARPLLAYKYSWMSSSLTAEGVSTPRSVNSRVSLSGGV
jgi:hypothetical protein